MCSGEQRRRPKGVRIEESRVNREISAPELLVIDASGRQLGIKTIYEALRLAEDADLDLVEVGPHATPPVARIMDYSKYRYEQGKKQSKQKKSSGEIKEVRLSLGIGDHDWQVKIGRAQKFLDQGHKVKITLRLSGRQMLFAGKATEKIDEFRQQLGGSFESAPQRLGPRYIAIIKR